MIQNPEEVKRALDEGKRSGFEFVSLAVYLISLCLPSSRKQLQHQHSYRILP